MGQKPISDKSEADRDYFRQGYAFTRKAEMQAGAAPAESKLRMQHAVSRDTNGSRMFQCRDTNGGKDAEMAEIENSAAEISEEIPDGISLFGEDDDGDTNYYQLDEEEKDAEQEAEEAEQPEGTGEEDELTTLTFNGEERKLTKEELKTAAQKGLNYDHVKAKADEADKYKKLVEEYKRDHEILQKFAQAAGVELEDYRNQADGQLETNELRKLMDGGMSEEHAKELLQLRAEHAANSRKRAEADELQQRTDAWNRFADYFGGWEKAPIKSGEDVPEAMKALMTEQKMEPLMAWLIYKEKDNAARLAASEAAAKNKMRTPGSARSSSGSKKQDAFLRGLFSD